MTAGRVIATFDCDPPGPVRMRTAGDAEPLRLCSADHLASAREQVDAHLTKFRVDLRSMPPSLEDLSSAVRELDKNMGDLAQLLVNDNATHLRELSERLRSAFPTWQNPSDIVPRIEVRSNAYDFPFELLPLFDLQPVREFANYAEAEEALYRFLGFNVVVRREVGEPVVSVPLQRSPRLAVQFLSYAVGSAVETHAMLREIDGLDVEDPWPPSALDDEAVLERLVQALYDPSRALDGQTLPGGEVQIRHFACHCVTGKRADTDYAFLLGSKEAERSVSLGNIRYRFKQLVKPDGPVARPLVVANACGSSKIDPRTRGSFPRWFVNNQHRAYLGTETDVQDDVATAFSERFYQAFITEERTLGDAIVLARRRLLADRGTPLGLLYSLYGDPELTVEP
jgi:hypothetical protein